MAYQKQNFADGTVLRASQLNHMEDGIAAAMEQGGNAGEDGGYYKPTVTQPTAGTMQVSYTASKSGMASVAPVTVTLPAGPAGDDGADGKTPVKGVDYYTEADKQEMVEAVINALPVYNGEVEAV